MSKVSRDKKKDELKGKNKPSKKTAEPTKSAQEQIPNFNKCCTCRFRAITKLCVGKNSPKNGQHVPRKQDGCTCYKCKVA